MNALLMMLLEQAIWLPATFAIAVGRTSCPVIYLMCMPLLGLIGLLLKKVNRLFTILIAVALAAAAAYWMVNGFDTVPILLQPTGGSVGSRFIVFADCLFMLHESWSNSDEFGETMMYPPLIMVLLNPVIYYYFKGSGVSCLFCILVSVAASVLMTVVSQLNRFRHYGKKTTLRLARAPRRNAAIFTAAAAAFVFSLAAVLNRYLRFEHPALPSGSARGRAAVSAAVSAVKSKPIPKVHAVQPSNYSYWWIVPLLKVIIFFAAAYAVIRIVYFVYKKVVSLFRQKWQASDMSYLGFVDETENTLLDHSRAFFKNLRGQGKRAKKWEDLQSEKERIRFLFRRYQEMGAKIGVCAPDSDTPRENCRRIDAASQSRLPSPGSLAELYDKARYGNIQPSHSDVVRIKENLL